MAFPDQGYFPANPGGFPRPAICCFSKESWPLSRKWCFLSVCWGLKMQSGRLTSTPAPGVSIGGGIAGCPLCSAPAEGGHEDRRGANVSAACPRLLAHSYFPLEDTACPRQHPHLWAASSALPPSL